MIEGPGHIPMHLVKENVDKQLEICGESEGLDTIPTLGGELHYLIAPFDPGCELTFGPSSALLHFAQRPAHERFAVEVTEVEGTPPGEVEATILANRDGRPLRQARRRRRLS